jgi:retron-type reverse transcriptase
LKLFIAGRAGVAAADRVQLDRELECRGHRFVRYADGCNIYVRSERAGQRVMESISRTPEVLIALIR